MPGPLKGNVDHSATNFDRRAERLDERADALGDAAKKKLIEAEASVAAAGQSTKDAFESLSNAGANALLTGRAVAEGAGHTGNAVGHALKGAGYGAVGALGWVGEGAMGGARFVARNLARGFAAIANALAGKSGPQLTVVELQGDKNAERFSSRMFGKAGDEFKKTAAASREAWASYTEAVKHAAGAGKDLAQVAGHTAGVAAHLVTAAAKVGHAGVDGLAALGVRTAAVAVEAAGQGLEGARDLAILSARFSAAVAEVVGNADHGKVKVEVMVDQKVAAYQSELQALVQRDPAMAPYVQRLQLQTP
jgi:hypothetical protein